MDLFIAKNKPAPKPGQLVVWADGSILARVTKVASGIVEAAIVKEWEDPKTGKVYPAGFITKMLVEEARLVN